MCLEEVPEVLDVLVFDRHCGEVVTRINVVTQLARTLANSDIVLQPHNSKRPNPTTSTIIV